jgi:predicted metal-dependent hydrolase
VRICLLTAQAWHHALMPEADVLLSRAVSEWNRGEHYEAHETLEDFADVIEEDDHDHAIAIALIHVAAALHKMVNNVGASAVPAKIAHALETLDAAPATWRGLELAQLRVDLRSLLAGTIKDPPKIKVP